MAYTATLELSSEIGSTAESSALETCPVRPVRRFRPSLETTSTGISLVTIDDEWLTEAFRRLKSLASLEANWAQLTRASPPNETAVRNARRAIKVIAENNSKANYINASVEEGVCIAFRCDNLYADIECFNNGEMVVATSNGNGQHRVWEIESDTQLAESVRRIQEFFQVTD